MRTIANICCYDDEIIVVDTCYDVVRLYKETFELVEGETSEAQEENNFDCLIDDYEYSESDVKRLIKEMKRMKWF